MKYRSSRLEGDAIHFVNEAYKHCKTIGASGEGVSFLEDCDLIGASLAKDALLADKGVVTAVTSDPDGVANAFATALGGTVTGTAATTSWCLSEGVPIAPARAISRGRTAPRRGSNFS